MIFKSTYDRSPLWLKMTVRASKQSYLVDHNKETASIFRIRKLITNALNLCIGMGSGLCLVNLGVDNRIALDEEVLASWEERK